MEKNACCRFSLFQTVAAKVESAAAFGVSLIGFESLPKAETWYVLQIQGHDGLIVQMEA